MSEQTQRVMVEGLDLSDMLRFPRILRSATAALQPSRLIIGLLMVTALLTGGRLWDRFTTPAVAPGGLLDGSWTDAGRARLELALADALRRYGAVVPETGPAGDQQPPLDARAVRRSLEQAYRRERASESTTTALRLSMDERFAQTLARIDSLRPLGAHEATVRLLSDRLVSLLRSVLTLDPAAALQNLGDLVIRGPLAAWRQQRVFTVAYGLFTVIVLAIGGGALSRMAACQWAGGDRIGTRAAFDFALRAWWRLVMSLLLPVLLILVMGAAIAGLGLLLRLPWGLEVIGAAVYGLSLALGALLAFLFLGFVLSASFLVPAVACENCDAADAQQRAYAYLVSRPLHRVGYGIVALIGLALGYLVVSLFVATIIEATAALSRLASDNHPALWSAGDPAAFELTAPTLGPVLTGPSSWSAAIIGVWHTILRCLVPSYVLAYFFTAATKVYLLLRLASDGQDEREIWRPGLVPGTLMPEMPEPEPPSVDESGPS